MVDTHVDFFLEEENTFIRVDMYYVLLADSFGRQAVLCI